MEELEALSVIIANITPMAALIAVIVGIWKSLATIRIKIEAEYRLKETARIESQIKLLTVFSKLVEVAHARKEDFLSETMVEHLLKDNSQQVKLDDAIITSVAGAASQDAAIESITALALEHEIIRGSALKALYNLKDSGIKAIEIEKCIKRIESES
ncbi:hypothetical protein [Pseudoalteromonas piscicida]|uniref:hypothetical protein n=1 Tax=Pseudoalteromonas piscicida TaxID=43662 RepID=UPI0005FA33F7|nr:hypothetical protein [Pseudoalteromonas piscicida]KJY95176.1 hypothetical protein TW73_17065 [Pseudoalteromonas piscicida]